MKRISTKRLPESIRKKSVNLIRTVYMVHSEFYKTLRITPIPLEIRTGRISIRIVRMTYVFMRSRSFDSGLYKSTHGPQCMYDVRTVRVTFTYEPDPPSCNPKLYAPAHNVGEPGANSIFFLMI